MEIMVVISWMDRHNMPQIKIIIMIFQMIIKILMKMQAFNDLDCISRIIGSLCRHSDLNNNKSNDYGQKLMVEGLLWIEVIELISEA